MYRFFLMMIRHKKNSLDTKLQELNTQIIQALDQTYCRTKIGYSSMPLFKTKDHPYLNTI